MQEGIDLTSQIGEIAEVLILRLAHPNNFIDLIPKPAHYVGILQEEVSYEAQSSYNRASVVVSIQT
jgi:hypothetical protein